MGTAHVISHLRGDPSYLRHREYGIIRGVKKETWKEKNINRALCDFGIS